ncbi:MAG: protein-L-isoaspartate(D-aspartate) O-methyltransferase [SAR324 cluster bacterium]|nr:protein-L-isoaspartate(D-aspartate) O-methyltransferase [SAR324 cluster bacterium]
MAVIFGNRDKKQNSNFEQQKKHLFLYWKNSRMITSDPVLKAFLAVPRELFVDPSYRDQSYADHPLPIGCEQTISQPTTVMLMLQLLEVLPGQRVLEIGAGSGYNAALLAELTGEVVTVERHLQLVKIAQENLKQAGYEDVIVANGDGRQGYASEGPYDRIMVTAAAHQVPQKLKDQLSIGGLLVAPIGATYGCEMLTLKKISSENFQTSSHGLFSFVPLV